MLEKIQKIGVVGAGQMGNGIVQVAAAQNFKVVMFDINSGALDKGLTTISGSLDRLIKKGTLTEDAKKTVLANISTSTSLQEV